MVVRSDSLASSRDVSSLSDSKSESASASSASSSDAELSSSSDSPSPRRLRARSAPRRAPRGRNAQLPTSTPLSTSLWTTREKQFEKFRASLLALPVPNGVTRVDKAKGYSLHVMSVLNWVLPDSLLHMSAIPALHSSDAASAEEEEPLLTLGVHVSLFHSPSKRFFGNTWTSPELALDPFQIKQSRHPKNSTLRYVVENIALNFRAFFLSDVVDASCVGVLELVAYEKDPDSKATARIIGCGWTLLPLFSTRQATDPASSLIPSAATSGDSVNVFTGSPRMLWELEPTLWNAREKHEGCKLYYQLVPYEPMLSVAMLVRRNELVGALDPIPGLKHGNLANLDMGKDPKTLLKDEKDTTYEETLASFVKLAFLLPKTVQFEPPIDLDVVCTRVALHLREEIEANLVARLRISRKAIHEGATSVQGEVSARVLKLALHNGRCFRTRQFTVPLKAEANGGDTLRCVRNSTKLRGFVCHPNVAIVLVLQYTVHFRLLWPAKLKQQLLDAKKPLPPEEDVLLVTMGARALVPSDGKKLYLNDKHHHATAASAAPLTLTGGQLEAQEDQTRVLHVDLLSGSSCRAYSDNTLYTPPDHVERLLPSREATTKDSFAFCDLQIFLDEPQKPHEEPAAAASSPVKPAAIENNQKTEEKPQHSAEQWAKKLLGKASSNAVLAQTLNALATSPSNQEQEASKPSSPPKKQQNPRSVDSTPQVQAAPTSELSRASKTLLTRYGYMDSSDQEAQVSSPSNNQKKHGKLKAASASDLRAKSLELEANDVYKANEVRFHFAAYRASSPNAAPSRVYFTFQFYTFPPTRTETLRLSKAFENGAVGGIQTFLLLREAPANKPSLAIQFDVDTTATGNPLEPRRFAEYLKWHSLYVDVWDADSLFQLGSFAIPLHELLRQGSGIKKFQAEVEITPSIGGVVASESEASVGWIQLLMSNYGVKGANILEFAAAPANPSRPAEQQARQVKHRVRARPLVDSNAELYRLLAHEGFYSKPSARTPRMERREGSQTHQRGASDGNSLTPKEIAILCELFGSRKSASDSRSTRIACDLEGRTGFLALLSLQSEASTSLQADRMAQSPREKPVAALNDSQRQSKRQESEEQTLADSAQRLKRVLALATKHHAALIDAFALFDTDGDGFLSRTEFIQALRSLGTVFTDLSDADLTLLGDAMDTNHDGQIAYREFAAFVGTNEPKAVEISTRQWREQIKRVILRAMDKGIRVHHVFAQMDVSGDGTLSLEEFERGLQQLGLQSEKNQRLVRDLLAELDSDQDGTISYTEFLASLGISSDENQREVVKETVKDITEDVEEILQRLSAKGVKFDAVFQHFDRDRNGTLSVEEFTSALNQLLQLEPSESGANPLKAFERDAVELFVKTVNADGDGKIDYREFLAACGVSGSQIQAETAQFQQAARDQAERKLIKLIVRACASGLSLHEVFQQFDADSDGSISLSEFQTTMQQLFLAHGLTEDDAALIAQRFDSNRDGEISKHEFQTFGSELQSRQQALVKVLRPHLKALEALDVSTKLSSKPWAVFCRQKLGFSAEQVAEIGPLLTYFGLVDKEDGVDVRELGVLCRATAKSSPTAAPSTRLEAVERLQTLLAKAKAQGVELTRSFAHFDANGDGKITRSELKRGLLALECLSDMDENELDSLLQQMDEDGSGDVNFSEFRALLAAENGAEEEEVGLLTKLKALMAKAVEQGVSTAACFAHFDKDGDGTITKEAFVTAMAELGLAAEEAMIHEVIRILDRNNSGTISLVEFKQLFPADTSVVAPSKAGESAQEAPLEVEKARTDSVEPVSARESTRVKLRALLLRAEAGRVDVKQCFAHFDADGNGVITTHEFVRAMKQLTGFETVRDEEILALVQHLDKDASGSVSLEEFKMFLRESTGPEVAKDVAAPVLKEDDGDTAVTASLAPSTQLEADQEVVGSEAADAAASKAPVDGGEASAAVALVPSGPDAVDSKGDMTAKVELTVDVSVKSPREVPEPAKAESPSSEAAAEAKDDTPQEAGEAVRPEQVANEGDSAAAPSESVASEEKTQAASVDDQAVDNPKPPARSVSFEQDKASETTSAVAAVDLESSKESTKPKGVTRRPSFAATRAVKATEKTVAQAAPLGEAAMEGLAKLRTLLRTAVASGVPIQQSFSHFDKAGDGVIPLSDFGKGLRELGPDFETLSDDGALAMAQSMDRKQQGQLRVEDFIQFLKAAAPAVKSSKTTEKTLEAADDSSSQLTAAKTVATAAARRPPPLRRATSSKAMEKKPATPSRGPQSARNQTSSAKSSALPSGQTKPSEPVPDGTAVARESSAAASVRHAAPPEAASRPAQQEDQGTSSFDCSYSFHSNPEIRAVELKLRQAAVDAYQRGILPLRVVAKFLEDDDDRRGRLPAGSGRDRSRKKRRELLRVEFLQVLMELGFSLLSDRNEEDEDEAVAGGRPRSTTRMNDHLYARQLERLSRYKHHVKAEEVKAHKQLVRSAAKTKPRNGRQQEQVAEASLQRFADEKAQLLRVLSYYRDGHKKALVYSLLREQVTTSLTLFPCLDALVFFELPFTNPYNHHERFRIELLLPSSPEIALVLDLALVRDSDEWTFYRQHLPLAYGASGGLVGGDVEVENEMIDDHDEVVMDAHDQLQLPLRLRWLDTSDTYARKQRQPKTVPVSVVLKSCSHGHTVALFKLELAPQPFTCHRVLRFSHPAASIWRWTLRYPRGKFVMCLDPNVAVEQLRDGQSESSNSGLVRLKCRVGDYPSLESFFVVLYDDRYYARVHEVWQIRIQAKLRVDVHAVLGQSVRHELVVKGDASPAAATKRLVKCFTPSQHRDMMQFRPAQTFALMPNAFNRIEFAFCAVETGTKVGEAAGPRGFVVLVNLVDVDTQQLVGAWSVHVTLALPLITKTYELRLPLGRAAQKKISYANPWDQPQTIVLRSSAPRLLVPREPVLQLPSNGQTYLRLAFAARQQATDTCEAIYLFINDKRTDQNEECLRFQVTYE